MPSNDTPTAFPHALARFFGSKKPYSFLNSSDVNGKMMRWMTERASKRKEREDPKVLPLLRPAAR